MNDLYDTKLCRSNTVWCHMDYLSQWWSEVFFHLPKFLSLLLVFAYIYISQGSAEIHLPFGGIYIIITLLQIFFSVRQ